MSTGGNVPSQGTTQDALSPQKKKRGDRGVLGEGTRGLKIKRAWRLARKDKEAPYKGSLREYARLLIKLGGTPAKDAEAWLHAKAHPPKRVPKPKFEKPVETKGSISIPKTKRR